jgi:hypothetical protein
MQPQRLFVALQIQAGRFFIYHYPAKHEAVGSHPKCANLVTARVNEWKIWILREHNLR